jgi:5'-nucleotidase
MRVAVVNDDGIHAPGLLALATALSTGGHSLTVVAPHVQRSGSGTSVGSELDGRAVAVAVTDLGGLDVPAYAVEGTPALIALAIAHGLLGAARPDVVVSGINSGHNVGRLTLFSGTLAVAAVAAVYGTPAIALSCAARDIDRYGPAAEFLADALDDLVASIPPGVAYNVNYPSRPAADVHGVRLARLHSPERPDVHVERHDTGMRVVLTDRHSDDDATTDIALLAQGFISLTPITAGLREAFDHAISQDALDAVWSSAGSPTAG